MIIKSITRLVAQSCWTLWQHGLDPTRLLCPWNSPGKNTELCSFSLPQGIFPIWDGTRVFCTVGIFFTTEPSGKPQNCNCSFQTWFFCRGISVSHQRNVAKGPNPCFGECSWTHLLGQLLSDLITFIH